MADLVGLNSQNPDLFGKISQLLQIRGARAQVAGAEQSQRQRAALAQYYSSGSHIGEDGTPDLNAIANDPAFRQAAGDQFIPALGEVAQAKTAALNAKSNLFKLRGDQLEAFSQIITPSLADPDVMQLNDKGKQKLNQSWMRFGQLYGDEAIPVMEAYGHVLKNSTPENIATNLRSIQLQALDVQKQREAMAPQLFNTGRQAVNVNPTVAQDATQKLDMTLPPGASLVTEPTTGDLYMVDPMHPEGARRVRSGNGGAAGPSPSMPPSQAFAPRYSGQTGDVEANQTEVRGVRAVADQAPTNRDIYRRILDLSGDTKTGPLVKYLQDTKIFGQNFGDNYQELAKYLEKNAITNMQAMGGPPSDARLSAAVAANGSTGFNPSALRAVTQFNYATNTGMEMYRKGMDRAVGLATPNYLALPEFKSQWASNFDIDALRLENAVRDKDEKAKAEVLKGMSKERAAELAQKLRNLESLSKTGKLP